jgi:hypothetical protein
MDTEISSKKFSGLAAVTISILQLITFLSGLETSIGEYFMAFENKL